jgi:hypothetical protein
MKPASSPLNRQVGGTHYQTKGVQHTTFCQRNRIPWNEACAIKYLSRHRRKNGVQDLEKAIHYMEFAAHEEYLLREEAGIAELKDINPNVFPIPLRQFLKDNSIPPAEAKIMDMILHHQQRKGESTLVEAINEVRKLVKTYETDFLDVL